MTCNHPSEAVTFVEVEYPNGETENTYKCEVCGALQGDEGFSEDVVVDRLAEEAGLS